MDNKPNIKNLVDWLKNSRNKDISRFLMLFIAGFAILSLSKFFVPNKIGQNNEISSPESVIPSESRIKDAELSYEVKLEKQLTELLEQISGVGQVSVMVTLENETAIEPAFNTISNEKNTEERDNEGGVRTVIEKQINRQVVMLKKSGEDEAMILKKTSPKIKGVLIVADGACSSEITDKLTKATATLLDLPLYKISVMAK